MRAEKNDELSILESSGNPVVGGSQKESLRRRRRSTVVVGFLGMCIVWPYFPKSSSSRRKLPTRNSSSDSSSLISPNPSDYSLDVNVERAEDVLTHKRLLQFAEDPANQPALEVCSVQNKDNNCGSMFVALHSNSLTIG